MENEHRPCALTNDEVTLPMAALGSAVDSLGPFVDGDAILDGILRRSCDVRFLPSASQNFAPGPPLREAVDNEGSQGAIPFDQRFTPPAQLIGSGGVKRRVTSARQLIAYCG